MINNFDKTDSIDNAISQRIDNFDLVWCHYRICLTLAFFTFIWRLMAWSMFSVCYQAYVWSASLRFPIFMLRVIYFNQMLISRYIKLMTPLMKSNADTLHWLIQHFVCLVLCLECTFHSPLAVVSFWSFDQKKAGQLLNRNCAPIILFNHKGFWLEHKTRAQLLIDRFY